jgi:hypothetical protein
MTETPEYQHKRDALADAAAAAAKEGRAAADRSAYGPTQREAADAHNELVGWVIKMRKTKRALKEALGHCSGLPKDRESREIVHGFVEELREYLDAIDQFAAGESLDNHLKRLVDGGE